MSVAAQRSVDRPTSRRRWTRVVRMLAGLLGPRLPLEPPVVDPLHVCPVCGMAVVNPVEWEESDDAHWRMLLRCGACEASREVVVSDRVAERFGRILDEGCGEIAQALARAERAGMEEWVEVFATALRRDLIIPDDFG